MPPFDATLASYGIHRGRMRSIKSMADFLKADVIVRELAHMSVIDTEDLRLLCGNQG